MTPKALSKEKCKCGSVQFKYNGDCLACGFTQEERLLISQLTKNNNHENTK